jgi:hypothetical protein
VVNQHNPDASKLMTYNGFTGGAQTVYAPSYMRGYNNYYTTLLVANPRPPRRRTSRSPTRPTPALPAGT